MNLRMLDFVIREALASIRRNSLMSLASVSTMALSLFVVGLISLLAVNLNYLASTIESQVEIRVYLKDGLENNDIKTLRDKIQAIPGVTSVTYVSKQEALDRLRKQFGEQQDLLESVEEMNPLPASFEIKIENPGNAKDIAASIKTLPGVDSVDYKQEIVRRLVAVTRALRVAGAGLIVVLAFAASFIISNTIRLTVFSRRKEIGIMKLVGATDSIIRGPFVLEGVILGVIGAAISAGVLWKGYVWLYASIRSSIPFLPLAPVQPLILQLSGLLVAGGMFLGIIGSSFSLHKFLRV